MANFNKSFNFRNGVQVDNDNFVINANGLVGIGTTVPTELLDVRGNVKVVGLVSATDISARNVYITGISTYSSLNIGNISISSGIITASTGIATYYGDGSKLSNIGSSYWSNASGGIYATTNVGIATTNPKFALQVGPDPLINSNGLGIDSYGNLYSNGIATAVSFNGSGAGLQSLNASNISSGTLNTLRLPSSIKVSGIITASSFSGSGAGLTSINASNISSGTLPNTSIPSNINITGIVTASSFVGNLTGTATTASSLVSTGTITLNSVSSGFASIGIATVTNLLQVVGFPAKIGVGTNSEPQSDIEVRKIGISSIRAISDNNIALIGIGRSAEIRTGNTDTYYSYSTKDSLDILNYNPGNVNSYLDYGTAGVGTGNFNWIHGQIPYSPLMSLTYDGNLGIGITNPPSKFYVVGTSYFSGITTIGSNLNVTGNATVSGSISGNISKFVQSQNTPTFVNNVLSIDATQGNVFTHTNTTNIGIVSFTGISTNRACTQTFTVLITQSVIAYNTTALTGIGTQLATIVTEGGVGYSTHIKVSGGNPITLTNSPDALDVLTFIVSYNGNPNIASNSFAVIGIAATNFIGA